MQISHAIEEKKKKKKEKKKKKKTDREQNKNEWHITRIRKTTERWDITGTNMDPKKSSIYTAVREGGGDSK